MHCVVCGSDTQASLVGDESPNLRGYGTRVCTDCGLEFIDPVPPDVLVASIYQADYRLHVLPGRRSDAVMSRISTALRDAARGPILSVIELRHGRSVLRRPPQGAARVLEVGFGSGDALERLYRLGWRVSGIEVADAPIASARSRMPDGDFRRGSAEDLPSEMGPFDLILLFHVLEHLDDPVEALRALSRRLGPGGTIAIAVPNRGSITRRLFGTRWYGYEHPEHLFQFTERSLQAAIVAAGLRVISTCPQAYVHGVGDSLGNVVDPRRSRRVLRRIAKVLSAPAGLIGLLMGDASALEVEAEIS